MSESLKEKMQRAIKENSHNHAGGYGWWLDESKVISQILTAIREVGEFRDGPFPARFPQEANMLVIYKEKAPELFR